MSHQIVQNQITSSPSTNTATTTTNSVPSVKKRKLEAVMTIQTDSSDEGLGSMSPEPVSQKINNGATIKTHVTHVVNAPISSVTAKDYQDLQKQMETERQHRLVLEEELESLKSQFYNSERIQYPTKYAMHREMIERSDHMNGHMREEIVEDVCKRERDEEKIIMRGGGTIVQEGFNENGIQHYAIETVAPQQHIQQHQYVVCTVSPPTTPRHNQDVLMEDDDSSRTLSSDELNKEEPRIVMTKASKKSPHYVRMPSILEQAIKAEPRVEVERIHSPSTIPVCSEDAIQSPQRICFSPVSVTITRGAPVRTYPSNAARPNLETIVEAIRHLEGDALFDMVDQEKEKQQQQIQMQHSPPQPQEVPLALTTNKYKEMRHTEITPFLKFHTAEPSQGASLPTIQVTTNKIPIHSQQTHNIHHHQLYQSNQQMRPGVIVVKSSS